MPRAEYLPDPESGDWEYYHKPDLTVLGIDYVYTGLYDGKGRKILKRVSRPVGFLASPTREYVLEGDPKDGLHQSQDVEREGPNWALAGDD